jgi:opacity protein-like surface antigen
MTCRPTSLTTVALAALAGSLAAHPRAGAEEVYFDTISTEKATRLHGAYFGGFAGGSVFRDADFGGGLAGRGLGADEKGGWFAGIEFGYSWQTPFVVRPAVELEFTYLESDLDSSGPGGTGVSGELNTGIIMANGILSLDLADHIDDVGTFWASFHPYVGAGAGLAFNKVTDASVDLAGAPRVSLDRSWNTAFAYQWLAGVEVALTDTFSVYGEYRRVTIDELAGGTIDGAEFDLWTLGFKLQY